MVWAKRRKRKTSQVQDNLEPVEKYILYNNLHDILHIKTVLDVKEEHALELQCAS